MLTLLKTLGKGQGSSLKEDLDFYDKDNESAQAKKLADLQVWNITFRANKPDSIYYAAQAYSSQGVKTLMLNKDGSKSQYKFYYTMQSLVDKVLSNEFLGEFESKLGKDKNEYSVLITGDQTNRPDSSIL